MYDTFIFLYMDRLDYRERGESGRTLHRGSECIILTLHLIDDGFARGELKLWSR